jgi:6-phosphofructokinase 2
MVITHGGDGSVMATRGAPTVRTPALEVRTHSAVGAGDSFVGGLIAAFLRGADDRTALRHAAACAAATRMSPGKSLFDPRDVKTLFGA